MHALRVYKLSCQFDRCQFNLIVAKIYILERKNDEGMYL